MADVHIIITGMVAIVPQRYGGARIVLKDLSRAHHAHQAHLLAELALTKGRPPSFSGDHWKYSGVRLGVWTLQGDNIRILNVVEGGLHINAQYIIRMREIIGDSQGASKIARALEESDDPSLIAARLNATVGTVSATWVHPDFRHEAMPPHGSDPGPRFTAEEVCLNFQIDTSPLRLEMDRFAGSSYTLEFSPNDKGRIEVQLGNLPPHEIIFTKAPKDPVKDTKDPHFPLYYDMCGSQPQKYPDMVFRDSSQNPLPNPPQKLHPHRLTMGFQGQMQEARAILHAERDDLVRQDVMGNTGSHNCPPVLWDEQ